MIVPRKVSDMILQMICLYKIEFYKNTHLKKSITLYNLELMKTIEEKNSLEGWAKVADNALREWHNDTKNIDICSMCI